MAKISELPSATSAAAADDLVLNQSGATKKIAYSDLLKSPTAIGSTTPNTGAFTTLSSTGNTILGDASTDTVTVNGYMGVGGAGVSTGGITVSSAALTGTSQYGLFSAPTVTSAATTAAYGVFSAVQSAAGSYTIADLAQFRAAEQVKGAGVTITRQHGIFIKDQTQGGSNYGVYSEVTSGANKWNIYASGTAYNYFAGRIGIGTTSPSDSIGIGGSGGIRIEGWTSNRTVFLHQFSASYYQQIQVDATSRELRLDSVSNDTGTVGSIVFRTGSNGSAQTRAIIDGAGNVGIGATPTVRLEAVDTSSGAEIDVLHVRNNATATNTASTIKFVNSTAAGSNSGSVELTGIRTGTNTGDFLIRTADSSSAMQERLRIDSSGNVGIGTSSPASLLDIQGVGGNGSSPRVTATTGTNYIGWRTANTGGSFWTAIDNSTGSGFSTNTAYARVLWSDGAYPMVFSTNSTERLRIDSSGNMLIGGTATPTSATASLAIFNGTAPTGSVTNGIVLYAEDVTSSSELKVRDEAGNVTTLSPHNFSLIPDGPSEDMAWAYYSEKGGKRINVDMLKLARMVEKLTGEKLVYEAQ